MQVGANVVLHARMRTGRLEEVFRQIYTNHADADSEQAQLHGMSCMHSTTQARTHDAGRQAGRHKHTRTGYGAGARDKQRH